MSRSVLGWDGAGGGYFDPPERAGPDDEPGEVGPPMTYPDVPVWCDRCGRPRAESEMCVACGDIPSS